MKIKDPILFMDVAVLKRYIKQIRFEDLAQIKLILSRILKNLNEDFKEKLKLKHVALSLDGKIINKINQDVEEINRLIDKSTVRSQYNELQGKIKQFVIFLKELNNDH